MSEPKPIEFVEIHRDNVIELCDLRIHQTEQHLLADNVYWLAQAGVMTECTTFGIYSENSPAGLMSILNPRLVEDESEKSHFQDRCLYVWRLMIDREHRNKGLGRAAIAFAIDTASSMGFEGISLTTMDREPDNALEFYYKLGFEDTGRRLDGEIELMLRH